MLRLRFASLGSLKFGLNLSATYLTFISRQSLRKNRWYADYPDGILAI